MKNLSCVSHFLRFKPRVVSLVTSVIQAKKAHWGQEKKINLSLKAKGFFFLRFLHMGTHLSTQTNFFFFFLAKAHGMQGLSSLSGMETVPPAIEMQSPNL